MAVVPFTGVVLTGGRSARMGRDKALLDPGDGGPVLAARALAALTGAGADRALAVGGDDAALKSLGFETLADDDAWVGQGPLAALVTALDRIEHEIAVVLSCDLPSVDADFVRELVERLVAEPGTDAVVPVVDGRRQVLAAAYRTQVCAALAERRGAGERSLQRALEGLVVTEWHGVDATRLVDLDRPDDVRHYAQGQLVRTEMRSTDDVDLPEIDVAQLAELQRQGVTLIDVRSPGEYEAGHVPGAKHIPLAELVDRAGEVPAGEPVYLICALGGRSMKAAEHLAAQGHDVTNVAGGTAAWIEAGEAVTTGGQP